MLESLNSVGGGPGILMHHIIDQGPKERMVQIGAFTLGLCCTALLAIPHQLPILDTSATPQDLLKAHIHCFSEPALAIRQAVE